MSCANEKLKLLYAQKTKVTSGTESLGYDFILYLIFFTLRERNVRPDNSASVRKDIM